MFQVSVVKMFLWMSSGLSVSELPLAVCPSLGIRRGREPSDTVMSGFTNTRDLTWPELAEHETVLGERISLLSLRGKLVQQQSRKKLLPNAKLWNDIQDQINSNSIKNKTTAELDYNSEALFFFQWTFPPVKHTWHLMFRLNHQFMLYVINKMLNYKTTLEMKDNENTKFATVSQRMWTLGLSGPVL